VCLVEEVCWHFAVISVSRALPPVHNGFQRLKQLRGGKLHAIFIGPPNGKLAVAVVGVGNDNFTDAVAFGEKLGPSLYFCAARRAFAGEVVWKISVTQPAGVLKVAM
jgi:hypothetical protein